MKIALVDNMNNNFFAFARYLRDLGIDADVYVIPNSNMKHFEIVADTFIDKDKLKFVKEFPVNIKNLTWAFFTKNKIYDTFKNYDLIVSCGLSSAYLERAGVLSDIIVPYGSDLYDIPFKKTRFALSKNCLRSFFWESQAKFQKLAYKKARVMITDSEYVLCKKALYDLNLVANNWGLPMLYNRENIDNIENQQIWSFLGQHDFVVFNHSRQYWYSNSDNLDDFNVYGGLKRNDKLINAFKNFIKETKFYNPLLVLFEYGEDVEYSKQLIKKLQIEDYVKWMPTMNRKNIMYGLSKATFSTNAFRENTTDIGGVCYETLAVGTPHINNCIEAIENPNHKFYQSPMLHALTEEEILNIFLDYEKNPQKYKEINKKSKDWFDENLGLGLAKKYVKLIELLANDKSLSQNDRIVREIFEK